MVGFLSGTALRSKPAVSLPSALWDIDFVPSGTPVSNATAGTLMSGVGMTYTRPDFSSQYIDPATGFFDAPGLDIPRVEAAGLLFEGLYTSLVWNNSALDNANWSKTAVTITANTHTHPASSGGSTSADTMTITNATHEVGQTISVSASTIYCFSFWAQRGTATAAKYSVRDMTNSVDLVAATTYWAATNTSSYVRVDVVFTTGASTASVRVYPLKNSGVSSGTMISSCHWCAALPFYARHLGTSGGTLSSVADLCSQTVTGHTAGAWVVRGKTAGGVRTGIDQVFVQSDDNSENNVARIKRDPSRNIIAEVLSGGSAIASLNLGSVADTTEFTAGISFENNSFIGYRNGGSVQTDVSGTVPSLTRRRIGGASSAGKEPFGNIRRVRCYTAAMSSANLQTVVGQVAA